MPRKVISVNFREEKDEELYKYLMEKGKIIGYSNYLKQLLYEDMKKDKGKV